MPAPGITLATTAYPWPSIKMSGGKLISLNQSLMDAGFVYQIGAGAEGDGKIEPITLQAAEVPEDRRAIDCSGEARWLVRHATGYDLLPDGSVNQHERVEEIGLKVSDLESGKRSDGAIRVFYLSPKDGGGTGHTGLLYNGWTIESHGHKGPDRREWGSAAWMSLCSVYVMCVP